MKKKDREALISLQRGYKSSDTRESRLLSVQILAYISNDNLIINWFFSDINYVGV